MHSNPVVWNSDGDTAELAQIVADVDRVRMLEAQVQVARVRALARAADLAEKQAARSAAKMREHEMALRSIAAELAGVLQLTDRSVQRQIDEARELVHDYPATLTAWEAGRVNRSHVRVITDLGVILPPEARAEYERIALEVCEGETPNRLKERLGVLVERMHPRSLGERHRDAKERRAVCVRPLRDGMSELVAVLPTLIADGILDRLTQQGHVLLDHREQAKRALRRRERHAAAPTGTGAVDADAWPFGEADSQPLHDVDDASLALAASDGRTMAQLRADLLADMLLTSDAGADPTRMDDGPGLLGALRAKVQVVVPALTLLGTDDGPASLIGRAPIDPDTARELAGSAAAPLERLLTDPVTGTVLQVDTYQRPARMNRYLRGRDQRCRGFGCTMPAIRCEVDHTQDWAMGGKSELSNLAHLCQRHHSMKQFTPWRVRQLDGGVLEWTSPLGRTYRDTPPVPAVHFTPDTYGVGDARGPADAAEADEAEPAPF